MGNPPYVRQEWLGKPAKAYFEGRFAAYHGMADLYVYFFERGFELLRPGGRLAYVVTNKWLRAGYAEPLRDYLTANAELERVVDLGHARAVFEDADVFPSILAFRKPDRERSSPGAATVRERNAGANQSAGTSESTGASESAPSRSLTVAAPAGRCPSLRVCVLPRDEVRVDDLGAQVEAAGFPLDPQTLGAAAWRLEPPAVGALLAKLEAAGAPLADFAGCEPLYGIKTGCNDGLPHRHPHPRPPRRRGLRQQGPAEALPARPGRGPVGPGVGGIVDDPHRVRRR